MARAQCEVWYDDRCGFCRGWVRRLCALDWLALATFRPISEFSLEHERPGLSRQILAEAMCCVRPDGRVESGARAVRFLALRLPLLCPLGLLLWLPGVMWLADPVYRWVSRRRSCSR